MTVANDGSALGKAVALITMGCAKNEVDSQHMTRRLVAAGYRMEEDPSRADCIIVNTCSFIQSATEESLEAVFEVLGLENVEAGSAKVVVAGCMPARYGAQLEESLPEANSFVPCSKEDDIAAVVDGLLGVARDAAAEQPRYQAAAALPGEYGTYAYVKISDGCDRRCAYCAIPAIRGAYHSFSFDAIEAEVKRAVEGGAGEICLIAQDTGRWGQDFEEPLSLAWLMDALAAHCPETWFRVLYLQPEGVTDQLLAVMAARDNVCSYLDIPLQHVDKALLRSMNRAGSRETFEALVERIQAAVPDITLRTTLIAGYPGETEEQFEELLDFAASGLFDYIGVFPFSPEEGTAAFDLPNQWDEDVRLERAQELRDMADSASCAKVAERVGRSFPVLVEGREEDGQLFGRAMCQAPEVDGCTYLSSGEVGEKRTVTIGDTLFYEMEEE